MKTIIVTRQRKLAAMLMPYWIIASSLTKEEFMAKYDLVGDLCEMSAAGFPVARLTQNFLESVGVRIENGSTVEIPIDETVKSIFASTSDGSLSNEIMIDTLTSDHLNLSARGGFKTLSHPYFEVE